jgi:predicted nucleotidyltransferase
MKIVGLVVEYNPFHNGHLYHLNKSKEVTNATHSIAVMSGNFLQRGEPALFDKYTRAQIAVSNGVDLVVELPSLFACQSAEIFSHGAVALLNSLNCIDSICFGSEEGDIDILYQIANILTNEPTEFKDTLKAYLDEGLLFAVARSKALYDYISSNNLLDIPEEKLNTILNSSNNILGIEYIKSLIRLNSNIKPYTITRIKSEYNSEIISSNICSATAIRKVLKDYCELSDISNVVPYHTLYAIENSIKKEFNPNIINTLNRLSELVKEEEEYIEKQVKLIYNDVILEEKEKEIILDLKRFNKQEKVIKSRLVLYTITRLFGTSKGIEKIHIEDIVKLCTNNIGNKYLTPNKNIKILVKNHKIYFLNQK